MTQACNPQKILLCGPRSFLATGLVEILRGDGHEVFTFSRGPVRRCDHCITGAVDQIDSNPHLQQPFDTILNFILLKDEDIQKNLAYVQALLGLCKSSSVKHLIHLSSMSCYDGRVPVVREDSPIETVAERKGSYGSLKVATDLLLMREAPGDLKMTFLRPGFTLGAGLVDPMVGMGLRFLGNRILLIGHSRNQLPLVLRQQVQEALVRLINAPPAGNREIYLLSSPNSPTRKEWLEAICQVLGAGTGVVTFPTIFWRAAGIGGELVARLLGMKIHPNKIMKNACRAQRFDASNSLARLGMNLDFDWKAALACSFPGEQPNFGLPYTSIPWQDISISQVTFLGYGGIVQQKHLPALKRLGFRGQVTAYDLLPGRDPDTGQEIQALPDRVPEPTDLLVLASPGPAHLQAIAMLQGLQAAILVEKPLCYSQSEFEAWQALAAGRKAPTLVCHNYRFKSNVAAMLGHLARYNPGKICHVQISFQSPSVGKDSRTWTRDERAARTLLMDYAIHFLDIACMLCSDGWQLSHARHEVDLAGQTSLIEGSFTSPAYSVNFLLRQGFMPRRCRILFTFQNYSCSLGFFPDTFVPHMADDSWSVYKMEGKASFRATRRKILDKLTGGDSDLSHAAVYLAAVGQAPEIASSISLPRLRSFYQVLLQLADAVYGSSTA